MNAKQWAVNLPQKVKIAIVSTIVMIAIGASIVVLNNGTQSKEYQINQSKIALAIKDVQIKSLMDKVSVRDVSISQLTAENKNKDVLLRQSEARKAEYVKKYNEELARQKTLNKKESVELFLATTGSPGAPIIQYDTNNYIIPIESIWSANTSIAANNMLTSVNKELTYDLAVCKSQVSDANKIIQTQGDNIADLKSALVVAQSKDEDWQSQINALRKEIKANKRKGFLKHFLWGGGGFALGRISAKIF